jgi:hypothetical protein
MKIQVLELPIDLETVGEYEHSTAPYALIFSELDTEEKADRSRTNAVKLTSVPGGPTFVIVTTDTVELA